MSALFPLSVNMVLWIITGAISPVIVNVYTNGSVDTNGCYRSSILISKCTSCCTSYGFYALIKPDHFVACDFIKNKKVIKKL